MKLASTRIVTEHVHTLAKFYERITGIVPTGCCDHYIEIDAAGSTLVICSQEFVSLFNRSAVRPNANRSLVIEFETDDVDKERLRLASVVTTFVMEPIDQPWGIRSMLFRDPDGNLINVFSFID